MAFKMKNNSGDEFDGGNDDFADINIIPLVDVMLVLLVIFMVTAPLSIGGIHVDLPFSKAKTTGMEEGRIVLSVNQAGDFFIDKVEVAADSLVDKFKGIFEFREKKELYIRADRGVKYGHIIDAMSSARIAGVTKISMLTQPPTTSNK